MFEDCEEPIPLLSGVLSLFPSSQCSVNSEAELLSLTLSLDSNAKDIPHAKRFQVPVNGGHINTLLVGEWQPGRENLVLCHGYGTGLGFFWKNYAALSQSLSNYNILAIDWIGMGNSSRPPLASNGFLRNEIEEETLATETEGFFVKSLEEWRRGMGISKMLLCSHSIGGYLSTCYALEYPQHVSKLVLISPAGFGLEPSEFQKKRTGIFYSFSRMLYGWNITPQTIIRSLGPLGGVFVRAYASSRFSHLNSEEFKALEDYLLQISVKPPSGEYSLGNLLITHLPGAIAKKPLPNRIDSLKVPITFIYGNHDWMDYSHALKAAPLLARETKVVLVHDAGHHLYLENPEGFNDALISDLCGTLSNRQDVSYPLIRRSSLFPATTWLQPYSRDSHTYLWNK
jgi:pimeloyl-ACP methyl ester carboxylesterase